MPLCPQLWIENDYFRIKYSSFVEKPRKPKKSEFRFPIYKT